MAKSFTKLWLLFLFAMMVLPLQAESNNERSHSGAAAPKAAEAEKPLYAIRAEPGAEEAARSIEDELNLRFGVYNRLFRFDPSRLSTPLNVRVFISKEGYGQYVAERLGTVPPGAIYIHYNQAERRELVINYGSPEEVPMLAHQAFLQYLQGFIPNPPAWIKEGFAIYFSTLRYNGKDTGKGNLDYEENLQWLETVKGMGDNLIPVQTILEANPPSLQQEKPENFQIASWALVSFFLSTTLDNYRTVTDSSMLLSPSADTAENTGTVMKRISRWNDFEALNRDFKAYLDSRKTFADLLEEGHKAYSRGDYMNAELSFMSAMDQRPNNYAPYYYLGLLSYEGKDYDAAEKYYRASLDKGADEALVNYALGINAAAAGRSSDAETYLQKAAALDPDKYKTQVEVILKRLGSSGSGGN